MRATNRHGFTLLEMIITLMVIAILSAIAIPTFRYIQESTLANSLSSEADLTVRNANSLAFSQSGADLNAQILQEAVNEAFATDTPTVNADKVELAKISGNIQCALIVGIVNGKAKRGEPVCTTDGTPPQPLDP